MCFDAVFLCIDGNTISGFGALFRTIAAQQTEAGTEYYPVPAWTDVDICRLEKIGFLKDYKSDPI